MILGVEALNSQIILSILNTYLFDFPDGHFLVAASSGNVTLPILCYQVSVSKPDDKLVVTSQALPSFFPQSGMMKTPTPQRKFLSHLFRTQLPCCNYCFCVSTYLSASTEYDNDFSESTPRSKSTNCKACHPLEICSAWRCWFFSCFLKYRSRISNWYLGTTRETSDNSCYVSTKTQSPHWIKNCGKLNTAQFEIWPHNLNLTYSTTKFLFCLSFELIGLATSLSVSKHFINILPLSI